MGDDYKIHVTSGVGLETGLPMITITVNGADWTVNASPADARSLAANLLEAAASAQNDAFFVSFLREAGTADQDIAQALLAFREWKGKGEK
ncbi:MAG: hypothetical protein WBO46_23945 [Caldilineaceae bacterium]